MSKITQIQHAASAYFGVSLDEIRMGGNRRPNVVAARHTARYLEREAGRSLNEIAELYGCSDHTTVLASVRHMAARLDAEDELYINAVMAITAVLKAKAVDKKEADKTFSAMSCPMCGAPIIKELQRQIALLHARVNDLQGVK